LKHLAWGIFGLVVALCWAYATYSLGVMRGIEVGRRDAWTFKVEQTMSSATKETKRTQRKVAGRR
jgi:hypothetical protein